MKTNYDGTKFLKAKWAKKQKYLFLIFIIDVFHNSVGNLGLQSYFKWKLYRFLGNCLASQKQLSRTSAQISNKPQIPWFPYSCSTKVATIITSYTLFPLVWWSIDHIFARLGPCGLMYMGICLKLFSPDFPKEIQTLETS